MTAALLLAGGAAAQSSPRTLSWPGRGEPAVVAPAAHATPVRRDLRRPNPVIPHGGAALNETPGGLTPAPGPVRRTLTPASAWLRPTAAESAPVPLAPVPLAAAEPPMAPAPPPVRPTTDYVADRGQPAPSELIHPAAPVAETATAAAFDPMAPRRDAPIFQMQPPPQARAAAEAPVPAAGPVEPVPASDVVPSSRQGGRYYSVHRQNGRQPDALAMPEPAWLDGLVVSEIQTMASQDLAAPEQGPTLIRDRNGTMRAAPAPSDGDHQ